MTMTTPQINLPSDSGQDRFLGHAITFADVMSTDEILARLKGTVAEAAE